MTGRITLPAIAPRGARIVGLGVYRPSRVVPNAEIVERLESSDEWIRTRSGIEQRRFASEDETVVLMGTEAARKALAMAGVDPADVGCVIVATVTHLYQTPAAAVEIAHLLGTEKPAAFDISAACAGFCHGLALASDQIRTGTADHVLVIGVERLSDMIDMDDRGTAFIFADGAGAAVLSASDTPGVGPVVWGSDGTGLDLISQKESWVEAFRGSAGPQWPHLVMQGNQVFRWASFEMAKVARQAIEAAGLTVDEIDAFVPHQANMRITDAMARALKLPDSVAIARDIAEQGNTSAASVPLALERMLQEGQTKSGDLALLIGFGAGLSYAAQVVVVP
jgi:3-oxoacyl-[acyl-carrier-protein] synthase-3